MTPSEYNEIKVDVEEWKEAETSGNLKCPNCLAQLFVISAGLTCIAYCIKCEKYFVAANRCKKCNELYEATPMNLHICGGKE